MTCGNKEPNQKNSNWSPTFRGNEPTCRDPESQARSRPKIPLHRLRHQRTGLPPSRSRAQNVFWEHCHERTSNPNLFSCGRHEKVVLDAIVPHILDERWKLNEN